MLARMMTWVGGLGAGIAALCCLTSLLPFLFGVAGLSALTPMIYRDSLLFPVLGVSLLIMGAGLWLKKKQSD